MKKDKAKKIAFKTCLGFACLAVAFGVTSNVSLSHASASEGVRTVASYFEAGEGVEFATNVNTPSYVSDSRNGVMVQSSEGGTLVYNNTIDTTKLTKDDLLFEVQYTPETLGVYEFKQLVVRMEDSVDPKCYVEVSLYRYPWSDNSHKKLTYVTVKTNTITQYKSVHYKLTKSATAPEGTNPYSATTPVQANVNQGTMIYGSFIGANASISDPIAIYYDDSEHAFYTQNVSCWPRAEEELRDPTDAQYKKAVLQKTGLIDENGKALVLDLDDHAHMGIQKSNLWTGFPSGKAKMSVRTAELVEDTARYMLLTVDNQALNGAILNDTTAPELSLKLDGYAEDELPKAQVGKYYPLFDATAEDKMYGELSVAKRVYKDGKELYFTGDGFIPGSAGEYRVDYVAYDGSRNKVIKSLYVTAETQLNGIEASFVENSTAFPLWNDENKNGNGNFEADLYYPVALPEMNAVSDGGKVTVEKEVFFNGSKVKLDGNVFRPLSAGKYEIVYTLTDYVGNSERFTFGVEANYSSAPLLETPTLPNYLVVGKANKFPAVSSQFYTVWQQQIKTYDKISLFKADGQTLVKSFVGGEIASYTPKESDVGKMIVEYSTSASEGATPVTYRKELTVLPFETLKDLFVVEEGIDVTPGASDLQFSFTADGQKAEFVNPISVYGGATITFNVPATANNFSKVEFILRDELNADGYIVVTIEKAVAVDPDNPPTVSYVSVNGGEKVELGASFYGNVIDNFLFTVMPDGSLYDYNDDLLVKPENFAGFTSGFFRVEFTAKGVEGDSVVAFKKIKNQTMFDTNEDFIKPVLTVFEEPRGQVELNGEILLSRAIASDVFDGVAKLTVTLTRNKQEIYRAEDAFGEFNGDVFRPTDYGTYVLQYLAEDVAGNPLTKKYNIVVRDVIAPVITVQTEMPQKGKVGEKLALPNAVAVDNVDWNLQVYVIVIDPMNVFTLLPVGEEYVPNYKGRYIVKYYCEDSNYNTTYSSDYVIAVE